MTLSDTDTAQLWETFRAGGGAELVRGAVRLVLQELIEAEVTEAVGAGRYERSDARVNERNGHRPRLLATQAGDVELRIPKLRRGSLLPSVLEPRRRIDRALHAVIMEAYVAGVSTRSVDDLVAALGAESGISKSEATPPSPPPCSTGSCTAATSSTSPATATASEPTKPATNNTPLQSQHHKVGNFADRRQ